MGQAVNVKYLFLQRFSVILKISFHYYKLVSQHPGGFFPLLPRAIL